MSKKTVETGGTKSTDKTDSGKQGVSLMSRKKVFGNVVVIPKKKPNDKQKDDDEDNVTVAKDANKVAEPTDNFNATNVPPTTVADATAPSTGTPAAADVSAAAQPTNAAPTADALPNDTTVMPSANKPTSSKITTISPTEIVAIPPKQPAAASTPDADAPVAAQSPNPKKWVHIPPFATAKIAGLEANNKVEMLPIFKAGVSVTSRFYAIRLDNHYVDIVAAKNNEARDYVRRAILHASASYLVKRATAKPILVVDSLRDFPFGDFESRCVLVDNAETLVTFDDGLLDQENRTAYTITITATHLRALQARGELKDEHHDVLFRTGGNAVVRLNVLLSEEATTAVMSTHVNVCKELRERTTMSIYESDSIASSKDRDVQVTLKQSWVTKDYAERQMNAVKLASALFFAHATRGVMSFPAGADVRMTLATAEEKVDVTSYVTEVGYEGFVSKVTHDVHNVAWKSKQETMTKTPRHDVIHDVIDVAPDDGEDVVVIRTLRLEDDKVFHFIAAQYGVKIGAIQGNRRAYGTCAKNTVLRGGTKIATKQREVAYLHRLEDIASEQDGGGDV